MEIINCSKCGDYTKHLIIFKGDVQFWQCQKCLIAEIPVLSFVNEVTKCVNVPKCLEKKEEYMMNNVERFSKSQRGRSILDMIEKEYGNKDVINNMTNEDIFRFYLRYWGVTLDGKMVLNTVKVIFDVEF